MSVLLFDTHAHPQDSRHAQQTLKSSTGDIVDRIALQSVDERDWSRVESLARALPRICCRIGFGIHPWFAPTFRDDADRLALIGRLRRRLLARPAAFVGEIGLDKVAVYKPTGQVEFERQIAMFQMQFQLAAELRRPVSVHVVHAHGHMLDTVTRAAKAGELPPAIALHSFSGKAPLVKQYLKAAGKSFDTLFFGFSAVICMRSEQRTREAIAAVPDDRLLLETDINDGAQIESLMTEMAHVVMDVKQWSRQQLAEITNANAERFFGALIEQTKTDQDDNDNNNNNVDDDEEDDDDENDDENDDRPTRCCDNNE